MQQPRAPNLDPWHLEKTEKQQKRMQQAQSVPRGGVIPAAAVRGANAAKSAVSAQSQLNSEPGSKYSGITAGLGDGAAFLSVRR